MKKLSYYFSDFVIGILTLNYFFIKKIIRKEMPNINKVRVLDFGCGTGVLASMFNKSRYIGFDLDVDVVSFAEKKRPGYSFKVGNATSFKIDNRFDLILVVGVLHHLNDLEVKKTALIINRLLLAAGKVLIIEATHPIKSFNVIGTILRKLDRGSYVRNVDKYSELLSGSLDVTKKYQQKAGILDYAVLVASNKGN